MRLPRAWRDSPWLFFAVVFALTWVFWIPAALMDGGFERQPVLVLFLLGGLFGKVLPPFIFAWLVYGPEERRDFWLRVIDFRRIRLGWYAVIFLLFPLFSGLAIATDVALGGSLPPLETAARFLADPLSILPFAVYIMLFGPLPEEIGWRGFELDQLQARWSGLSASLILGMFWTLWHVPMFFIEGTYHQAEVGLFTFRGLNFFVATVASAILMTWVYNQTQRSTLSAVLIHFVVNFTGEFLDLPDRLEYIRTLWSLLAMLIVIAVWGTDLAARRQAELAEDRQAG